MGQLKEQILKHLSVKNAFKHVRFLVEEVGERIAGSREMEKAAAYTADEMQSYNMDTVNIDRFDMYHSYPQEGGLKVLSPEKRIIAAKSLGHIASTLPEGLRGELVHIGGGGYEDYEGKNVKGKILHLNMSWAPARPEKARIAAEKGAKAIIISNWGLKEERIIQLGAIKDVWGNPTPETIHEMPDLPAVSISRAAGEYLMHLCQESTVKVEVSAKATREWVEAKQPVGRMNGSDALTEFVLVGGHLEAWGGTAICNSSGNGLMLELARVLSKYKDKLKRSIVFGFWDGHEVAEAAGSTHFVDTHWNDLSQHCVAYVNIDNPGIKGTSVPQIAYEPALYGFPEPIVEEYFGSTKVTKKYMYKGGDASFFGVGVPYFSFSTGYTEEELIELHQASLSPWIHSEKDTLDKIDRELFGKHLKLFADVVLQLCTTRILPYNPKAITETLLEDLNTVNTLGKQQLLEEIISQAQELQEYTEKLQTYTQTVNKEDKESIAVINQCLRKVNRNLSHVLRTVAGKYGQDPYDYSYVKKPVPRLYIPATNLGKLEKDTHEYRLWYTKLLRETHVIGDAIQRTVDFLATSLPRVQRRL